MAVRRPLPAVRGPLPADAKVAEAGAHLPPPPQLWAQCHGTPEECGCIPVAGVWLPVAVFARGGCPLLGKPQLQALSQQAAALSLPGGGAPGRWWWAGGGEEEALLPWGGQGSHLETQWGTWGWTSEVYMGGGKALP